MTFYGAGTDEPLRLELRIASSWVRPVDEGMRWSVLAVALLIDSLVQFLVAFVSRHVFVRFMLGSQPSDEWFFGISIPRLSLL